MNNWVSVDDLLPDEDAEVLCFGYTGSMMVGLIYHELEKEGYYAEASDGSMLDYVTHWLPLPKPPKLKENETNG